MAALVCTASTYSTPSAPCRSASSSAHRSCFVTCRGAAVSPSKLSSRVEWPNRNAINSDADALDSLNPKTLAVGLPSAAVSCSHGLVSSTQRAHVLCIARCTGLSVLWMHARLPPPYGHAGLGCSLDPWPRIRFVRTQRNHNLQYDTVPHRVGPHSVKSTNHNLRCRCRAELTPHLECAAHDR